MGIKLLGFDEIDRRAIKLREIVKWYQPHQSFTMDAEADRFLESNPLAPIIGTICDQQITAEDAWRFPLWLCEKLGCRDFTAEVVYKSGQTGIAELLKRYMSDKWPSGMSPDDRAKYLQNVSKYIIGACKLIVNEFSNNPDNMFKLGSYNVPQVYFILRSLPGIGAKKASMIARDFALSLGNWFSGISKRLKKDAGIVFKVNQKHFSEVPVDVHVVRVFGRMMGEFKRTPPRADFSNYSPDIQNLAKLAFPDFPSKLDEILWAVGREYCKDPQPACDECPLLDLPCNYSM